MHPVWRAHAAIERRMERPVFRSLSRALGRALIDGTLAPVETALACGRANETDLLFAVRCQGVAGHLRPLLDTPSGNWGAATLDALHVEADRIAQRSSRLRSDLVTIAQAAQDEQLPWSPLKGTWLRLAVDLHPERRPSGDIDILIDPADVPRWDRLLRRLGYVPRNLDRHAVYASPGAAPVATPGDHPDHPRPVEVHTRISEVVCGVTQDVTAPYRAGLVTSRVAGMSMQAPAPEALALHLVLHGAAAMLTRGLRLSQLLDLRHLSDNEATRAVLHAHLPTAAWALVALAGRDLPGLVPDGLRTAIEDSAPGPALRRAILSRPGVLEGDPLRWRTIMGEWRLAGSRHVVRRLRGGLAGRIAMGSGLQSTTIGAVGTYLWIALDRFTDPRLPGASGE